MNNSVCWINTVSEEDANAELSAIYQGVRSPDGQLDNLYQGFSLRPQTIRPADDLYKAALHHADNTLPKWFSELIGTLVAVLAGCKYAQAHHGQNFLDLLGGADRALQMLNGLQTGDYLHLFEKRDASALRYVKKLCQKPETILRSDIEGLRKDGWDDAEILEIVQVVAMFSYFVRVINGVGISLGSEKVGLY